jgi:hypothetical protein
MGTPTGGYYQNGLGAYLNFYLNQGDLKLKIDESLAHFRMSTQTMDGLPCFGVYRTTFPIVSLGSAIGRDTNAFGSATGTVCSSATTPVFTPLPDASAQTPSPPKPVPISVGTTNGATTVALTVTCTVDGVSCKKLSDTMYGSCRTLQFTGQNAATQVKICPKNGLYEMYLQTPWSNGDAVTCVEGNCVSNAAGFARFA